MNPASYGLPGSIRKDALADTYFGRLIQVSSGGVLGGDEGGFSNAHPGWSDAPPNVATWVQTTGNMTSFSGASGGSHGRILIIENLGAVHVMLINEASTISAKNRFSLVSSFGRGHTVLFPGDAIMLAYDGLALRWKKIAERPGVGRAHWRRYQILPGTGATPQTLGLGLTTQGTITHTAPATGSFRSYQRRITASTGAVAGTTASVRGDQLSFAIGDAAGLGGFVFHAVFSFETLPSTAMSFFIGLIGQTSDPGNVNSSTFINHVGFGANPADTNLFARNNDGSGAATNSSLGTDFPITTTPVFEFWMSVTPNQTANVNTTIWRLDDLTIAPASSRRTTNLPLGSQFMTPTAWISNRAGAADYAFNLQAMEVFSPN